MRSLLVVLVAVPAFGQTYNAFTGGWNTGLGTVYGSFGYAMATQDLYNTVEAAAEVRALRKALIKKHGLEAVEKAEREARGGKRAVLGGTQVTPLPVAKGVGKFKPDKKLNTAKQISDA